MLEDATRELVERLLASARSILMVPGCTIQLGDHGLWVVQDDDSWSPEVFLLRLLSNLADSDEWHRFEEALLADDVIAYQLTKPTGTAIGSAQLHSLELASRCGASIAIATGRFDFDAVAFGDAFREMLDALKGDKVSFWVLAPIVGLRSVTLPIHLSDSCSFGALTPAERQVWGEFGGYSGTPRRNFVSNRKRVDSVLRYHFTLPRPVDTELVTKDERKAALDTLEEAENYVRDALAALVVSKRQRVTFTGVYCVVGNAYLRSSASGSPGNFTQGLAESLTFQSEDEISAFIAFWENLRATVDGGRRDSLLVSVRRFASAMEAGRSNDQLIDLTICAEALFLSDPSDDDDAFEQRGEQQYRLAHRAALFLTDQPEERLTTFELFQEAYRTRNRLVHGGIADSLKITPKLRDELARALVKAAEVAAKKRPGEPLMQWKRAAFGLDER